MRDGGVVSFSDIDSEPRLNTLIDPRPMDLDFCEYNYLRTICSNILGDIDKGAILRIQSNTHPIYRSSDKVSEEDRDSNQLNKPEIMTRYLRNVGEFNLSESRLDVSIFILINHSCFKEEWDLEYCRKLMELWKTKIQDGLKEFLDVIGEKKSSPTIDVMVYSDVDEIERNPLRYYAEVLKKRPSSDMLVKKLPSVFIDCSPLSNHKHYRFNYNGLVPEFTLCFSLIQDESEKIDANELDEIAKNIGSGFTIFQRMDTGNPMKSVAEVLKIGSVLSAKMVIGDKHKHVKFFEHLSNGAFFESRKTLNSKSISTKLNKKYRSRSNLLPSGIKNLTKGWIEYNGDQAFSALTNYSRALLHCKYESDDRGIRDMLELRLKDWSNLTYYVATYAKKQSELDISGNPNHPKWYRLAHNSSNKNLTIRIIQYIRENLEIEDLEDARRKEATVLFEQIRQTLKRRLEVTSILNIDDFEDFYAKFTELIFKIKDMYYIASRFYHTNAIEKTDISKLNDFNINFHLSTRLKLYKHLKNYLESYKILLRELRKSNPAIANALREVMKLDINAEEVVV